MANDPVEGHSMLREGATLADIMLRRAIVHGLARVEQPWATEILQRMQVEDDQWAVRNLANQYLEQMTKVDPRVPRKLNQITSPQSIRIRLIYLSPELPSSHGNRSLVFAIILRCSSEMIA